MHVIVPFAAPLSEAGRAAMRSLSWPQLARLLAVADIGAPEGADEWSLNTPAERALAEALDWPVTDGLVPMARLQARADGLALDARPLALLTPVHWHLGTEQVSMGDPAALQLDEAGSQALFERVAPLFTSEGFELLQGAPGRWYLRHDSLATLPTASLDRAIGRNVDGWLGAQREARLLRRLQNEVQMLLHGDPWNAERERRGLPVVNSVWISGTGPALAVGSTPPVLDERLRAAALAEDWAAWAASWALLDAELGTRPWTRLTLCGERGARTLIREPAAGWRGRLRQRALAWRRVPVAVLLEAL